MIITGIEKDPEAAIMKAKLLGSFLFFTQTMFKIKTGRDFFISEPISREPHQITIARQLTDIFYLRDLRVWMHLPPGHGKSTFFTYFVPWCWAHYADCQFIYVSYGIDLAANHTSNIRDIMMMPLYRKMFGVEISTDSSAKADFQTTAGGAIKAFGSSGPITGYNSGLPNQDRFTGCTLMDDMHKPNEVFSDTIRQGVITNYNNTIKGRVRGPNVPIIGIGHALHEDDLQAFLVKGRDGHKWKHMKLAAEDEAGNVLAPNIFNREMLNAERDFNTYVYWSQYQGSPQPAGGGIFKTENFEILEHYPEMLVTFITIDTAESVKNHADYTVFSFWGLYEIKHKERNTGDYGLHWIDCFQDRIEPADLEEAHNDFYRRALDFKVPPRFVAIEKKSTGTTLSSVLKKIRGFEIKDIERTAASGSKVARYFEAQPYTAKRLVSLPKYAKHTAMCLEHMRKITANNTHQHDDIADTLYDAVKIAFIDKGLLAQFKPGKGSSVAKDLVSRMSNIQNLRGKAYGSYNS